MRICTPGASRSAQTGFGLVELLLCASLLAVLASAALPSLAAMLAQRRVEHWTQELGGALRHARAQAMASGVPVRLSLGSDAGDICYLVHTGDKDDCRCEQSQPACKAGVQLLLRGQLIAAAGLQLSSNVRSVSFDPDTGFATPAASISIVRLADGQGLRQVLSPPGRLRICRLGSPHAQYPACS